MLDVSPDRGTRNGRWCERKRAPKVDASGDSPTVSVGGIELFFFPGYGFTIACTGEKKGPSRWPSHRCRVFRALARYTSAPKVRPVATRRTLPEPQKALGTEQATLKWKPCPSEGESDPLPLAFGLQWLIRRHWMR